MAGKYQAYLEYKNAKSKWLDMIPSHWERAPVKHLVSIKITDGPHETPEFVDEGVPFLSAEAVKNNALDFSKKRGYITQSLHEVYRKKCLPKIDDVFMVKSGNTTGNLAIVETEEEFNIWSPLALIRADQNKILPRFIFYSMLADFFRTSVELSWSQGTQPNIGMGVIENLHIATASLDEQRVIIGFLDHEIAKIDTLIEKQQQLIKLLKEKRQAVISHAVTKGLNPNAPMRDSGVEWLGEVPEHWEVKRLKFSCDFITLKKVIENKKVIALENIESWTGKHIKTDSDYCGEDVEFEAGDILFGKLRPYLAKVYFAKENGYAFGDLLVYRPKENLVGKYCFYQMINEAFVSIVDSSTYGSKMPRASSDFISNMNLLLPPLDEQRKIVQEIENKLKLFESIDLEAKLAIKLMQERRTALISAAVTGKIDVRKWHPSESNNKNNNKEVAA